MSQDRERSSSSQNLSMRSSRSGGADVPNGTCFGFGLLPNLGLPRWDSFSAIWQHLNRTFYQTKGENAMENDEAIFILKGLKRLCYPDSLEGTLRAERDHFALDIAIKSLEAQKTGTWKLCKDGSAICSECNFHQKLIWDLDNWQNYCGVCGARMTTVVHDR